MKKTFQDGRIDQRLSGTITERIDAYIGYILTAGRRRSFFCDHRSPLLCAWCQLLRNKIKGYHKEGDLQVLVIKDEYPLGKTYIKTWILYYRHIEPITLHNFKETIKRVSPSLFTT